MRLRVVMAEPRVLILGHSFIRRLHEFVRLPTNALRQDFDITTPMTLRWHGVGGRTVAKVIRYDLEISPTIFAWHCYSPVGYEQYHWLFNLFCSNRWFTVRRPNKAKLLHEQFGVTLVCVCQTMLRGNAHLNVRIRTLTDYLRVVYSPSICILLETQGILEDNTVILIARWSSSEPTWTV